MEKVCAVVDAQGFIFKDRFVAREVAVVSDFLSQCQELNPQLNWRDLPQEEQAHVLWCTKSVHGLHFCPFNPREHCFLPKSSDIGMVLSIWYEMTSTPDRSMFAYKNRNVGIILKEMGIPCLDLDDPSFNFPTVKELKAKFGSNYVCAYHKKPPPGSRVDLTCAYRKSNQIYREMLEILNNPEAN